MACDKGTLLCKVNTVCRSKAKTGICSLNPIYGQVSRHVLGSRFWVCIWVALDDKCRYLKCSNSSSFPSDFIGEWDIVWFGTSIRSVGVRCPNCVTPHIQPASHQGRGCRESLDAESPAQQEPKHWCGTSSGLGKRQSTALCRKVNAMPATQHTKECWHTLFMCCIHTLNLCEMSSILSSSNEFQTEVVELKKLQGINLQCKILSIT